MTSNLPPQIRALPLYRAGLTAGQDIGLRRGGGQSADVGVHHRCPRRAGRVGGFPVTPEAGGRRRLTRNVQNRAPAGGEVGGSVFAGSKPRLPPPATEPAGGGAGGRADARQVHCDGEQTRGHQGLWSERVADLGVGPVQDERQREDECGEDREHAISCRGEEDGSGAHLTLHAPPAQGCCCPRLYRTCVLSWIMDDLPIGPTRHYVIACHDGRRIDADDGRNARCASPRPPGFYTVTSPARSASVASPSLSR
jgi:hypothetical protein